MIFLHERAACRIPWTPTTARTCTMAYLQPRRYRCVLGIGHAVRVMSQILDVALRRIVSVSSPDIYIWCCRVVRYHGPGDWTRDAIDTATPLSETHFHRVCTASGHNTRVRPIWMRQGSVVVTPVVPVGSGAHRPVEHSVTVRKQGRHPHVGSCYDTPYVSNNIICPIFVNSDKGHHRIVYTALHRSHLGIISGFDCCVGCYCWEVNGYVFVT
jgi:hypothetical protein